MQHWDSNIPEEVSIKLELLLQRRRQLAEQEKEIHSKQLVHKHKQSVLLQSSNQQTTVDNLLENEKANLIQLFDEELIVQQSSRRYSNKRFPTLEQSTISFQEQSAIIGKSSKTNRSASTNVSCFNTHSPSVPRSVVQEDLTLKLQESNSIVAELKSMLEDSQIKYQQCSLELKKSQLSNKQLENKVIELQKEQQQQQEQQAIFKANLVNKLTSYANKLGDLNENEQKLIEIQQENARLKQEKEELIFLLKHTKQLRV